jgi:dihydropteroate synthase
VIWKVRSKIVTFDRALLMGVVNVTPDSFSDGGNHLDPVKAAEYAVKLTEDGADILDLGGESTRPGAEAVSPKEELKRLLPVLKIVREKVAALISIDTTKAEVAKACLDEGADIINDVSGLRGSGKKMAAVVKKAEAGFILMHSRGTPETMQTLTQYQDLTGEILKELAESVETALKAGVDRERIVIDPGLGFAKTAEQNLEILRKLKVFQQSGYPVLVGPSRKSFIGAVTGREERDREFGTAACVAECVMQGAQIIRVHDVRAMRDVARMAEAIKGPA